MRYLLSTKFVNTVYCSLMCVALMSETPEVQVQYELFAPYTPPFICTVCCSSGNMVTRLILTEFILMVPGAL
jgi:hypothetical protein